MKRAWWVWCAVALAVVADGAASARAADSGPRSEASDPAAAGAGTTALEALPWVERITLEQAMAAADARYAPRMDETGPRLDASNAHFSSRGAHVDLAGHALTLRTARMGRGASLRTLPSASPSIVGPEVRTTRGAVVEWWRALPSGLEHGVTIRERPAGEGALLIEVATEGGLTAHAHSDDVIELVDASGIRVATYAHLVVLAADGAHVPARMSVRDGQIIIAVEDDHARYPLVVDPIVSAVEASLLHPAGAADDLFGCAVAFSADGSRVIVGAYDDDTAEGTDGGSAHVFLRTTAMWMHEATLIPSDAASDDFVGVSVALSADGSRALLGGHGDGAAGSARVFVRVGTTWTEEARLRPSGGASGDLFGWSVALSADGSRALMAGQGDDTAAGANAGSVRVFVRSGASWTEEAMLVASDAAAGDNFGLSLALSADGLRALVGAPLDTAGGSLAGSARVFVRAGATWTEEATLLAPGGASADTFGSAVALSADGSRALVGARLDDTGGGADAGSAQVFVRTGGTWVQEATLLATAGAGGDRFGDSVTLSADGIRALVGAPLDDTTGGTDAGSARVFIRTGTSWVEEATLLAVGGASGDQFGDAVVLSTDGSRALVGAPEDDTVAGAGAGSASIITLRASNGTACGSDASCSSGFCVDGVCCASACGGGAASNCQACSAALTGGVSGVCALLAASVAPTVTCRPVAGLCDHAEMCTSTSAACPPDVVSITGTPCRAAVGLCDVQETCDGDNPVCPFDGVQGPDITCRVSTGACDPAEQCSGDTSCPADTIAAAGTLCGPPATAACDLADVCNGSSPACPALFQPAGTVCAASSGGICDAPDECTGTSADCMPTFIAGVECRASSGGCDPAEVCGGASATCPPDQTSPAGTVCRRATDATCDVVESCDGTSGSCPADITSCVMIDAGPSDAGSGADAGPPIAAGGCACRAARSGGVPLDGMFALALLFVLRRVRRARAPSASVA